MSATGIKLVLCWMKLLQHVSGCLEGRWTACCQSSCTTLLVCCAVAAFFTAVTGATTPSWPSPSTCCLPRSETYVLCFAVAALLLQ
jgi:hypothetical protein